MSHILTYFAFCLFRVLRHIMNYRLFLFPSEISMGGERYVLLYHRSTFHSDYCRLYPCVIQTLVESA